MSETINDTSSVSRGISLIEQEIMRAAIHRCRRHATEKDFTWFRWWDGQHHPEQIPFRVRFNDITAEAVLSREQVRDCCERVVRADVQATVDRVVGEVCGTVRFRPNAR